MTTTEQLAQALRDLIDATEQLGELVLDAEEFDAARAVLAKYEAEKGRFINVQECEYPKGETAIGQVSMVTKHPLCDAHAAHEAEKAQEVLPNGLTEEETSASASVAGLMLSKRAAPAAPVAAPRTESTPVWSEDARRIGELLLAAWSKAEPAHGVTLHPVSYRATFYDMARAVLRDLAAQAEPVAARYDFDGYGYQYIDNGHGSDWQTRIPDAEMLYTKSDEAEIRADERERCARLCEAVSDEYQKRDGLKWPELKTDAQEGAQTCAHRIRERGQG